MMCYNGSVKEYQIQALPLTAQRKRGIMIVLFLWEKSDV
nr:MAG TPA: hypothetical protein [Caudoviricetes sp.]